jgi:hypothetical protein
MANYIASYDLNGSTPTHAQMDKHMQSAGWARGRILETVWYVGTSMPLNDVFQHVEQILSSNDRLFVVQGSEAKFRNLLINNADLVKAWHENA